MLIRIYKIPCKKIICSWSFLLVPCFAKKITVTSLAAISPHPTQTIRNLLGCLKYQTHPSEKFAKRVGGPVEQEGSEDFLEVERYRTTVEYMATHNMTHNDVASRTAKVWVISGCSELTAVGSESKGQCHSSSIPKRKVTPAKQGEGLKPLHQGRVMI